MEKIEKITSYVYYTDVLVEDNIFTITDVYVRLLVKYRMLYIKACMFKLFWVTKRPSIAR